MILLYMQIVATCTILNAELVKNITRVDKFSRASQTRKVFIEFDVSFYFSIIVFIFFFI